MEWIGEGEGKRVHGVMEWDVPKQWCPNMCQAEHEERRKTCRHMTVDVRMHRSSPQPLLTIEAAAYSTVWTRLSCTSD